MKGIMMLVFAVVVLSGFTGCQDVASYDGGNDAAETKAAFDQAIPEGYEVVIRRIGDPGPCAPAADVAGELKPTPAAKPATRTILPTKSAEKPAASPAPKKVAAAEESAPAIPPTGK